MAVGEVLKSLFNSGYVLLIVEVDLGITVVAFVEVTATVDVALPTVSVADVSAVLTGTVLVSAVFETAGDTVVVRLAAAG